MGKIRSLEQGPGYIVQTSMAPEVLEAVVAAGEGLPVMPRKGGLLASVGRSVGRLVKALQPFHKVGPTSAVLVYGNEFGLGPTQVYVADGMFGRARQGSLRLRSIKPGGTVAIAPWNKALEVDVIEPKAIPYTIKNLEVPNLGVAAATVTVEARNTDLFRIFALGGSQGKRDAFVANGIGMIVSAVQGSPDYKKQLEEVWNKTVGGGGDEVAANTAVIIKVQKMIEAAVAESGILEKAGYGNIHLAANVAVPEIVTDAMTLGAESRRAGTMSRAAQQGNLALVEAVGNLVRGLFGKS